MDFYFGVPLRSRASSRDWNKIVTLFEATLSSLLHQSDGDFEVIVACHDVPETALLRDPRVTVVQADFAPPADFPAQMVDKGRKKQMIARTVGDRGGGYLMMVDADDLVSRRLVDFVHRDRDPHGYVFKTGFELDHASGRVRAAPRFNNLCGTSAIIRFSADDLPSSRAPDRDCYFGRFGGHPQWEGVARAANRPLKPLPFPGAMYVVNHSQNHSVAAGNIGWKRRLYRLAFPGKKVSAPLSQDFTIASAWGMTAETASGGGAIARQGAVYLAIRIGGAFVSALMISVYTRQLTAAEYGTYALIMSVTQLAFSVSLLWIGSTILRFLHADENPARFFTSLIGAYLAILAMASAACALLWFWTGDEIGGDLIFLGLAFFAAFGWSEIQVRVAMARIENKRLAGFALLRTALTSAVSAALLLIGWGPAGMLIGATIGTAVPGLWFTIVNRSLLVPRAFSFQSLRESCRYGIPLSLSFALEAGTFHIDRLLLGWLGGPAAVGLYAVGLDIADKTIRVLMNPMGGAAFPIVARSIESDRRGAEAQLSSYVVMLFAMGAAAGFGLAAIAPTLSHLLLGEEFHVYAVPVITILSIATLVSAMKGNYLDFAFQFGRRTSKSIVISLIVVVASACFSLVLTPRFGAIGAATASLCTCCVGFLAAALIGRVTYRLPLPCWELAKVALAGVAMVLVVRCLPGEGVRALVVQIASGGTTYLALLLVFNLAGARDRIEPLVLRAVRGAA